jgi:hypothetical protein
MSTDHTILVSSNGTTTLSLDEHSSLHDLTLVRNNGGKETVISLRDLTFDDLTTIALRMLTVASYSDGEEAVAEKIGEYLLDPTAITRGSRRQT